jgi:hypothetical protein
MESILETKAATVLQFFAGWRETLSVNLLRRSLGRLAVRDLLQPQVEQVLVCNPRRNAFLKEG